MLSFEEIEEALPIPIKIEICCNPDDFNMAIQDSIKTLLSDHNKNYETKIENIIIHYISFEDKILNHNECRICIGKEDIHFMKGLDLIEDSHELSEEYYRSIINLAEAVLKTWHEKIIGIQNENELKLAQFKIDGYDELLYGYYCIRHERKAFEYLKKLAARYPNSKYVNQLRHVYRTGLYGWHKRNDKLSKKMSKREYVKHF